MIIEAVETKWFKIEYIMLGQTIFAHKHTVEVRAKNANEAVQWFINQRLNEKKEWFILEVYERDFIHGRTKWKPLL